VLAMSTLTATTCPVMRPSRRSFPSRPDHVSILIGHFFGLAAVFEAA
jgi:hypothetical protein